MKTLKSESGPANKKRLSRRSLLANSSMVGAGMGLFSGAAALAQQTAMKKPTLAPEAGAKVSSPSQPDRSQASQRQPWSHEYWAHKGEVKLYMFRKRATPPPAAAARSSEKLLPVLLLIHGSSNSGRSSFDLATPGHGEYSVMNIFATLGYDVWTMDHENYGRSSQTAGNSDIASGVQDIKAGMEVIRRETGQQKAHLFGESSGGLRAGAYAMLEPEHVDRLGLGAFTYKGDNSPTLAERGKNLEFYRTHNRRKRDRDMIRSIFTRDKAGTTDPAIAEFLADEELKFGDEVPTGTYLDMTSNLPLVDPKRVLSPVFLVRGEYDGIATVSDLTDFFSQLPNGDRQFVILPGMAHSVVSGTNRQLFWHALHAFLSMPKPVLG
jgi:pimeloyl-ACP methyl ester carboxylesterase